MSVINDSINGSCFSVYSLVAFVCVETRVNVSVCSRRCVCVFFHVWHLQHHRENLLYVFLVCKHFCAHTDNNNRNELLFDGKYARINRTKCARNFFMLLFAAHSCTQAHILFSIQSIFYASIHAIINFVSTKNCKINLKSYLKSNGTISTSKWAFCLQINLNDFCFHWIKRNFELSNW